jgi:uncharacterized protein YdeI (YjbR/CyaY-like superfamily)
MGVSTAKFNPEVTSFLDNLNHPLRNEIELLRGILLNESHSLTENIKWNSPNYCHEGEDRITVRIHPPKQIQIIFHRGSKKLSQPKHKLITDETGLLAWKENDRAVMSFKAKSDIEKHSAVLTDIIRQWIAAARE